jgi:hypothetical protein
MNRSPDQTIAHIETHLDPAGEIRRTFLADPDARQHIDTYARAAVDELDAAFADGGGADVTADEMAAYLRHLLDTNPDA